MGKSQMHYAKWKMPDPKIYILYGCICVRFWKGKVIETENQPRTGVNGIGWAQKGTEAFRKAIKLFYIFIMVVTWKYVCLNS